MVSPTQKRQTVEHVVGQRWCSERRACRYLGLHRCDVTLAIETAYAPSAASAQRIVDLSWTHSRYGYRRIRALSTEEGWQVSRRQVQRVRRMEGL